MSHIEKPIGWKANLLARFTKFAAVALACWFVAIPAEASAQIYSASGAGGTILTGASDNIPGTPPLVSTAFISGSGVITDVSVDFSALDHTYVGDLTITLTHPNGLTSIDILSRPGRGSGSRYGYSSDLLGTNTYSFSDAGITLFDVSPGSTLGSGVYIPSSNNNQPGVPFDSLAAAYIYTPTSFAATFAGLNSAGTWTLTITDWALADTGSLGGWTVNVSVPEPSTYALLMTSGLVATFFIRRRRR